MRFSDPFLEEQYKLIMGSVLLITQSNLHPIFAKVGVGQNVNISRFFIRHILLYFTLYTIVVCSCSLLSLPNLSQNSRLALRLPLATPLLRKLLFQQPPAFIHYLLHSLPVALWPQLRTFVSVAAVPHAVAAPSCIVLP